MAIAPQFLRTNKQVRIEGRTIMLKINSFSIVLNQASYLGYSSGIPVSVSVVRVEIGSIPPK